MVEVPSVVISFDAFVHVRMLSSQVRIQIPRTVSFKIPCDGQTAKETLNPRVILGHLVKVFPDQALDSPYVTCNNQWVLLKTHVKNTLHWL